VQRTLLYQSHLAESTVAFYSIAAFLLLLMPNPCCCVGRLSSCHRMSYPWPTNVTCGTSCDQSQVLVQKLAILAWVDVWEASCASPSFLYEVKAALPSCVVLVCEQCGGWCASSVRWCFCSGHLHYRSVQWLAKRAHPIRQVCRSKGWLLDPKWLFSREHISGWEVDQWLVATSRCPGNTHVNDVFCPVLIIPYAINSTSQPADSSGIEP